MDRMTKHGSPKSKGSPTKSTGSRGGAHYYKRWKSGYSLFQHLWAEKYGKETGMTLDDMHKAWPKVGKGVDNKNAFKAAVWHDMSDRIKQEFKDVADDEAAPKVPAENQAGIKFHEWLEEGRIDEYGNEINPPEEDLMKYITSK